MRHSAAPCASSFVLRKISHVVLVTVVISLLIGYFETAEFIGADLKDTQKGEHMTLMVYLCGSDLESENGSATADIMEMLGSGYDSEKVNILFMAGGSSYWWSGFDTEETAIYQAYRGNAVKVFSDGLLDMGDPSTLSTFLNYGYENCPADSYALIIWNHGGGPLKGVCWDRLADNDNLSMQELQEALENSPFAAQPLEWIGFDACLMASVETAFMMSPYARYMIASQETEPSTGWNYTFLNGIDANAEGAVIGQRIVDTYIEGTADQSSLTLSCIDLARIQEVGDAMDDFFADLAHKLNSETFSQLSNLRQDAQEFGHAAKAVESIDLIDLEDLLDHYASLAPEKAKELKNAIDDAVICSRATKPNSCGISVYHPYSNKELYQESIEQNSLGFSFSDGYMQYVKTYAEFWLGDAMADWSNLDMASESINEDELAQFTFQLNEEQLANFASAQLIVLEASSAYDDNGNYSYTQVYTTQDVSLDAEGTLSAVYTGRSLYCVGEDGEPITDNLTYDTDGEYIIVSANVVNHETGALYHTLLYCTEDEKSSGDLKIDKIYVYDEGSGQFTNRLRINLSDFNTIFFPDSLAFPAYEGDILLGYDQWKTDDNTVQANFMEDISEKWRFHFFDTQLSGQQFYASFQITDTQSNTYSTPLTEVVNPKRKSIPEATFELDDEYCKMNASVALETAEINPKVLLTFRLFNPTDRELEYKLKNVMINGSRRIKWQQFTYLSREKTGIMELPLRGDDLYGLEQMTSVEAELEIKSAEGRETIKEIPILLHMDEDISEIWQNNGDRILAQAEVDGIEFELVSLEEEASGSLYFGIHILNHTDEPVSFTIEEIAINGYGRLTYEDVFLNPQEDTSISNTYLADEWFNYSFEHFDGDVQMVRHSLLSSYGVSEISDVSIITDILRADLHLKTPFQYEQKETDEPIEKVCLYEFDGITIDLEQIWVIDHGILMAVEVRNESDHDQVLQICDESLHGTVPLQTSQNGGPRLFTDEKLKTWAGVTSREYLHMYYHEDKEDESATNWAEQNVSSITFSIVGISYEEELAVHDITINLNTPAAFDVQDGIYINGADLDISCVDYLTDDDSGPAASDNILMAQGTLDRRRELSLTLTPEQMKDLKEVTTILALECDTEPFWFWEDDQVTGTFIIPLEQTTMQINEDGTVTGALQGVALLCGQKSRQADAVRIVTEPDRDGFAFRIAKGISLYTYDKLYYLFLELSLKLTGQADRSNGTVSVTKQQISADSSAFDHELTDGCTNWPLSCFRAAEFQSNGFEVVDTGNGEFDFGTHFGDHICDYELDTQLEFELIPAEEALKLDYAKTLNIVYLLTYNDGTIKLLDMIPWC